jgi:hypothetical protein
VQHLLPQQITTSVCCLAQSEAKSKQEKAAEDAYWREAGEGSKSKAAAKREEEEKKRLEQLARKAELKRLQEQEEAELLKPKANPKANRVTGQKVGATHTASTAAGLAPASATATQKKQLSLWLNN